MLRHGDSVVRHSIHARPSLPWAALQGEKNAGPFGFAQGRLFGSALLASLTALRSG